MAIINVKGFIEIPSFVTNTPNTIAELGQLSNHARTFSVDQDEYSNPDKDAADLVIFESLALGTRVEVPNEAVEYVFDIMDHAYANFVSNQSFEEQLTAAFGSTSGNENPISSISVGSEVLVNGKLFPTWISFTLETENDTVNLRLWLSDSVFRAEFDSFDIKVVGPTGTVPELYSTYENVNTSLAAIDLEQHVENVEQVRASNPFTKQKVVDLEWVDPNDSTKTHKVNFFCLVYGPLGENRDNLLDSIRQYLVDNSTHTLEEWVVYFPELLSINQLHLIPQWDRVAMAAVQDGGNGVDSVYSPVFRYDVAMDNARKLITGPTLTELKAVTDLFHLSYRTLGVVAIGDKNNAEGTVRFSDAYPDYTVLPVNSTHLDSLRAVTSSLITKLGVLVRICEDDDGTTELPTGYSRVSVEGASFVEHTENNIVFRMVTKQSYLNKVGG